MTVASRCQHENHRVARCSMGEALPSRACSHVLHGVHYASKAVVRISGLGLNSIFIVIFQRFIHSCSLYFVSNKIKTIDTARYLISP